MVSNLIKTENDNIDYDIEIESKTTQHVSN